MLSDVVQEIDGILEEVDERQGGHSMTSERVEYCLAVLENAIDRLALPDSTYVLRASQMPEFTHVPTAQDRIRQLKGILSAMRADYAAGRVGRLAEAVRMDVYADLLDMAEDMVVHKQKDAAASLVGPVLEEHLRSLCEKHGIQVTTEKGGFLTGSALSAALYKTERISRLEQKSLATWVDVRNSAAHGRFDQYDLQSVEQMVDGVRAFISRHPA